MRAGKNRKKANGEEEHTSRMTDPRKRTKQQREREIEAYGEKKRGGRASISPGLQCGVWLAMATRGRSW
jgi:hypothetical protein